MTNGKKEVLKVRIVSVSFFVFSMAIFKPFGLGAWQWKACIHLVALWLLGFLVCLVSEAMVEYLFRMPHTNERGVEYIIRRNLRFQVVNTLLVSLMVCLYRHFMLSSRIEGNRLSWANFLDTLGIVAFSSFAIGIYWRFKFRSRYLKSELEETRQFNEQLQKLHQMAEQRAKNVETSLAADAVVVSDEAQQSSAPSQPADEITLSGSTSESVTLCIQNLLYVEAVGNYVKVFQWHDGRQQVDMLRTTSKQVEETLAAYPMIVRCHRAFIVNLCQVDEIISKGGAMQLVIKHCNDALPVSRSNMAGIKEAVKTVLGE
ncbi:MAG: LytTR family transcriptional regulator DNA-binding domain-containing protein [Bacteroidaceae bacterium]|nr:LytTR family transcriptional regulator DNA-binding domain-containing protein [Bacteroidaceae bacterium]